ncbi:hypothetical protein Ddc_11823 [Ditylenchus destructor]|nr:hypothetical protein Ddc_11823 [Ditylenchus destructor]
MNNIVKTARNEQPTQKCTQNAILITKAICCLHNYLTKELQNTRAATEQYADKGNEENGRWREFVRPEQQLRSATRSLKSTTNKKSAEIREILVSFVNNEGSVISMTDPKPVFVCELCTLKAVPLDGPDEIRRHLSEFHFKYFPYGCIVCKENMEVPETRRKHVTSTRAEMNQHFQVSHPGSEKKFYMFPWKNTVIKLEPVLQQDPSTSEKDGLPQHSGEPNSRQNETPPQEQGNSNSGELIPSTSGSSGSNRKRSHTDDPEYNPNEHSKRRMVEDPGNAQIAGPSSVVNQNDGNNENGGSSTVSAAENSGNDRDGHTTTTVRVDDSRADPSPNSTTPALNLPPTPETPVSRIREMSNQNSPQNSPRKQAIGSTQATISPANRAALRIRNKSVVRCRNKSMKPRAPAARNLNMNQIKVNRPKSDVKINRIYIDICQGTISYEGSDKQTYNDYDFLRNIDPPPRHCKVTIEFRKNYIAFNTVAEFERFADKIHGISFLWFKGSLKVVFDRYPIGENVLNVKDVCKALFRKQKTRTILKCNDLDISITDNWPLYLVTDASHQCVARRNCTMLFEEFLQKKNNQSIIHKSFLRYIYAMEGLKDIEYEITLKLRHNNSAKDFLRGLKERFINRSEDGLCNKLRISFYAPKDSIGYIYEENCGWTLKGDPRGTGHVVIKQRPA